MQTILVEMEEAFQEAFRQWWPFAQQTLLQGGRVYFHVALEMTKPKKNDKPPTWFVQGSLNSSHKPGGEVIDFTEGHTRRNR